MTTKWTKGPWYLSDGRYICKDSDGGIIARVHGEKNSPNATLLCAAPEMAEALKAILGLLENYTRHIESCDMDDSTEETMQSARAILAKIGGAE
jgi:hypothetical protein